MRMEYTTFQGKFGQTALLEVKGNTERKKKSQGITMISLFYLMPEQALLKLKLTFETLLPRSETSIKQEKQREQKGGNKKREQKPQRM